MSPQLLPAALPPETLTNGTIPKKSLSFFRTGNDNSGGSVAIASAPVPPLPFCSLEATRRRAFETPITTAIQTNLSNLDFQVDEEGTLRNTELPPCSMQQGRRQQSSETTTSAARKSKDTKLRNRRNQPKKVDKDSWDSFDEHLFRIVDLVPDQDATQELALLESRYPVFWRSLDTNLPKSLFGPSASIHDLSSPLPPNSPKVETEAGERQVGNKDSSVPLASFYKFKAKDYSNRQAVSAQLLSENRPVETFDDFISSSAIARGIMKALKINVMRTDTYRPWARMGTHRPVGNPKERR